MRSARRWVAVEMLVAAVGVVGSVVVALVARLTGLTEDDRHRARIVRDAELWRALPASEARDALEEHIAAATSVLLDSRKVDRRFTSLWGVGTWFAFGAWVLFLVVSAVPWDPHGVDPQPFWIEQVRYALLIATSVAVVLAAAFWLLAIAFGGRQVWAWVSAKLRRHAPGGLTSDGGRLSGRQLAQNDAGGAD